MTTSHKCVWSAPSPAMSARHFIDFFKLDQLWNFFPRCWHLTHFFAFQVDTAVF